MGATPDREATRRAQEAVPIGGIEWVPRKLTNKRLKQVRQLANDAEKQMKEAEGGEDSDEAQNAGIQSSLAQIATMLRHPESDDSPTLEFLEEELDTRDIGPVLRQLVGTDDEGNSEASEAKPEAEATSG